MLFPHSLLFLLLLPLIDCGCYPTGANCVPEKPFQTNIKWHSCQEYCNKCKGFSMGDCVKSFTKLCNGKWKCECSGHKIPTSNLPIDKVTCLMGV